ncbi:hypothetical protein DEIPH_ctg064orf0061 [Deinococcus phoenicis]|uniref:Uncharacterized protein n=1 Tax=Deinococcus phoenicis TaxID=1476583 RepID=A0A016QLX5_9DEIO|nr:hypothetical protein [Deinococcus phoenicis]EYB66892.1 hypothetical protein DEIPH_ctg064orf0061 [Deinococcus phoenicis]
MNPFKLAAPLALGLLAAAPAFAQTTPPPQPTELQEARVQVARETAQVRLLERSGQLRPAPVAATCLDRSGHQRLRVLTDAGGTPRVVRFDQQTPDNAIQFTGYYDAAGRLRYATGSASGFSGPLYNLTAEYDARGRLLYESGMRRPGWSSDLRFLGGLSTAALRLGRCPA